MSKKHVLVVGIPNLKAPLKFRKELLGLTLLVERVEKSSKQKGRKRTRTTKYVIKARTLIKTLGKESLRAAFWWETHLSSSNRDEVTLNSAACLAVN